MPSNKDLGSILAKYGQPAESFLGTDEQLMDLLVLSKSMAESLLALSGGTIPPPAALASDVVETSLQSGAFVIPADKVSVSVANLGELATFAAGTLPYGADPVDATVDGVVLHPGEVWELPLSTSGYGAINVVGSAKSVLRIITTHKG